MAQQNRTVLKGYFNTGDTPTEAQFADLIDSFHNPTNDGTVQVQPSEGAFANGDKTKLDGIEASADVTDEANVLAALNGATITAVTPTLTDKVVHQDASDSDNLKTSTVQALLEAGVSSSAAIPTDIPDYTGQVYVDTLNSSVYISVGASSAGDWLQLDLSASGTSFTGTNNTGSTITAGTPVYLTGAGYAIGVCDTSTASTFPCVGVTSADIANSASGTVVCYGAVTGLDTSEFSVNNVLYPYYNGSGNTSFEAGATGAATPPTTGKVQPVATVVTADAGSGIIWVNPQISGEATIKQSIWAPANSMTPATTFPAEAVKRELATNDVDVEVLRFATGQDEYAVFSVAMPKGWDEGTVTFQAFWTHNGASTPFGVSWGLQAIAFGNDDALDATWGTAVVVDDTGGTNDDVYITAESGAVTIAGTPAEGDMVIFRVFRDVSDTNDDMATDADLLGVKIFYTANTLDEA